LSHLGYKVLILDGDLGLANIDVILGLRCQYSLQDVMEGFVSIDEVILSGPGGFKFIPSGSGISQLQNLTYIQKQILFQNLRSLSHDFDFILIDTGAGIGENVLHLNSISEHRLVVTTPEPHAITDAYAFIKTMKEEKNMSSFDLIINMTNSLQEGEMIANRIVATCQKFLNINVNFIACIPYDKNINNLIMRQSNGIEHTSKTLAGRAWGHIASYYTKELENCSLYSNPNLFWKECLT
jgi:flagellar biosynthesis protein FlhG